MKRTFIILCAALMALSAVAQPKKSFKRGVGENSFSTQAEIDALAPGVSWYYDWSIVPSPGVASYVGPDKAVNFVPMAWNGGFDEAKLRGYLTEHPGIGYILGFNEPNFKAQANMTPTQAAEAWPAVEKLADDFGLEIVSPALNYPDGAINDGKTYQPKDWLQQFINVYTEKFGRAPRFDYIGLHCYMNAYKAQKNFVDDFAKTFGKKVWLTEFCAWEGQVDSVTQVNAMVNMVNTLENDTNVHRYAWFKAKGSNASPFYRLMFTPSVITHKPAYGTLSVIGKVYTNMSSFDKDYYWGINQEIPAKDYVKSNAIQLWANTDTESSQAIEISNFGLGAYTDYQVEIPAEQEYTIQIRQASEELFYAPLIKVSIDGAEVTQQTLEITGAASSNACDGTNKFVTSEIKAVLPAGKHTLRLTSNQSTRCRLNWFRISGTSAGIENVGNTAASEPVSVEYFNLAGAQVQLPGQGVFIQKTVYADGSVKSVKVIRK